MTICIVSELKRDGILLFAENFCLRPGRKLNFLLRKSKNLLTLPQPKPIFGYKDSDCILLTEVIRFLLLLCKRSERMVVGV